VDASNAKMSALMAHLSTLIDEREDDVRAYRLPPASKRLACHSGRLYGSAGPMACINGVAHNKSCEDTLVTNLNLRDGF
jgi:hypothetical protein